MKTVKLGDVCENLDAKRIPLNNLERIGKGMLGLYPYIGANNIVGYIDEFIFDEKILCVAEDGGSWGANQKCAFIMNEKCWVNNHAHVLRTKSNTSIEYLMYYLNYKDLNSYITGSTRGKLNKSALERIQIPLPSLPEQRRIAALLDRADSLRQKDRLLLTHYDSLAQSLFLDMFGDDKDWQETTIGELGNGKGSMRTGPFGSDLLHSEFVDQGIFVLGIDNVVTNRFEWAKSRFITREKYERLKRYTVYPGDVLISIMGTTGRTAVVPDNISEAINSKHLAAITLNKKQANPTFLSYSFLFDEKVRFQLSSQNKGAIMDGLNLGIIKALKIKLPPLELQTKFAELIGQIEAQKVVVRQQMTASEGLFSRLLQDCFGAV